MAVTKGIDIVLAANTGTEGSPVYTVVGGQRGATLNRSAETIDVTNKVSGGWKENLSGFKEWSIDCDGLYIIGDAGYAALATAFGAGTAIKVQFDEGTKTYSGSAYITDFPIEAPYDDAATYSISLQGTGALTYA